MGRSYMCVLAVVTSSALLTLTHEEADYYRGAGIVRRSSDSSRRGALAVGGKLAAGVASRPLAPRRQSARLAVRLAAQRPKKGVQRLLKIRRKLDRGGAAQDPRCLTT
jgi:hypothetical protein